MNQLNFPKSSKLCHKKMISALFTEGLSSFAYPIKLLTLQKPNPAGEFQIQMLASVSKKKFKKAVDRNYIKRLIKEAYRINQNIPFEHTIQKSILIHLGFIYVGKDILTFQEIEKSMKTLLRNLNKSISIEHD